MKNNKASEYDNSKLINNKRLLKTLHNRQKFFKTTRDYFYNNEFLEINTPTLMESPGIELYIEPFKTIYKDHYNNEKMYYLPTSPEFALKEALSLGIEKIFEIAKVFRNNGEDSDLHRPEFYMLEWYRAFEDYYKIMDDCIGYLKYISKKIYKRDIIIYKGKKCSLKTVRRIKIKDLFKDHGIDLDNYSKNENLFKEEIMEKLKLKKDDNFMNLNKDDLFFKFFLTKIEPDLGWDNPVIIYEYPIEMCTLSRKVDDDPKYGERFELYICGIEIANAFGELTDPVEQRKRFKHIINLRKKRGQEELKMPEQFLKSLEYGLPPCSGIALGLERLFMLFEGLDSIKDTNIW